MNRMVPIVNNPEPRAVLPFETVLIAHSLRSTSMGLISETLRTAQTPATTAAPTNSKTDTP